MLFAPCHASGLQVLHDLVEVMHLWHVVGVRHLLLVLLLQGVEGLLRPAAGEGELLLGELGRVQPGAQALLLRLGFGAGAALRVQGLPQLLLGHRPRLLPASLEGHGSARRAQPPLQLRLVGPGLPRTPARRAGGVAGQLQRPGDAGLLRLLPEQLVAELLGPVVRRQPLPPLAGPRLPFLGDRILQLMLEHQLLFAALVLAPAVDLPAAPRVARE
mmetsp:Transcript_69903/g.198399  ORF Transcript_69903/g.198399 Transcript_69903/m.198399 type:complete len:216 (-) Transcript_69903:230-877(-)